MQRKAFILQVYPDKVAEYVSRHNPIWPEMAAMLREHGVSNYSIHLADDNTTLFGYAEVESEERWAAIATTEVCRRWWESMAPLMRTNDDTSPETRPLREVFHLA